MLKRILNLEGAEELTTKEQKSIFGEAPCENTDNYESVKTAEYYGATNGDRQCTSK